MGAFEVQRVNLVEPSTPVKVHWSGHGAAGLVGMSNGAAPANIIRHLAEFSVIVYAYTGPLRSKEN